MTSTLPSSGGTDGTTIAPPEPPMGRVGRVEHVGRVGRGRVFLHHGMVSFVPVHKTEVLGALRGSDSRDVMVGLLDWDWLADKIVRMLSVICPVGLIFYPQISK